MVSNDKRNSLNLSMVSKIKFLDPLVTFLMVEVLNMCLSGGEMRERKLGVIQAVSLGHVSDRGKRGRCIHMLKVVGFFLIFSYRWCVGGGL